MDNIFYNNLQSTHLEDNQTTLLIDIYHQQQGQKNITLDAHAKLDYICVIKQSDIELNITTKGEYAQSTVHVIVLSKDQQKSKVTCISTLQHSNTQANMSITSFVGEGGDIEIIGGIKIQTDIQQVQAHLTEKNIILGQNLRCKVLPMLDVQSNDVSASHGATIDQINAEHLFYLTAKGLHSSLARQLIIQSYINTIFDPILQTNPQKINQIKQNILADIINDKTKDDSNNNLDIGK